MSGGSLSDSYSSLDRVYRGTTLPQAKMASSGIMESFKKALTFRTTSKKLDPLLDKNTSDTAVIINR